jgi:hypothetical protein
VIVIGIFEMGRRHGLRHPEQRGSDWDATSHEVEEKFDQL